MIGNFDIYPGGDRSGTTPQPERYGVDWSIDLIKKGSAKAKLATGRTQRINAMSMSDGYGSDCCHDTHRVGEDIDLGTDSSTWNYGNGTTSSEEQKVISHAISFVDAGATGRVIRFITSNQDIYDGIHTARPNVALYYDTSGGHQNHLHIDVGPPTQVAGLANLAGDFNLDDVVDARDYVVWARQPQQNAHAIELHPMASQFRQNHHEPPDRSRMPTIRRRRRAHRDCDPRTIDRHFLPARAAWWFFHRCPSRAIGSEPAAHARVLDPLFSGDFPPSFC